MKVKRIITGIVITLIVAAAAVFGVFFFRNKGSIISSDKLVFVESVRSITGVSLGNTSRFMGVVESQESKGVQKDSNLNVKEIFVKPGDTVKEGDDLFSYDTTDMELNLEQLNLDRQGIQNTIEGYYSTISDLEAQRDAATDENERLSYESQITSTSTNIKEEELNLQAKDNEIKKQQDAIDNSIVKSPMSGIIKTINSSGAVSTNDDDDSLGPSADFGSSSGNSNDAFITIIAEGNYRIKGTTDEMNIHSFTSGTKVILRSRVDESVVWKAQVAKVDMEPKNKGGDDDGYYGYGGMGESASNYNFYVTPKDTEGMMLGQHLYIELDVGQGEKKEGLYLASYYIMQEESGYYVWKRGADEKITKAQITVGEYDEDMDSYEVTGGLSLNDYIAYPGPDIVEGCKTTTNYDDIVEQGDVGDDALPDGDDGFDGSMTPGDAMDDMDDMFIDDFNDGEEGLDDRSDSMSGVSPDGSTGGETDGPSDEISPSNPAGNVDSPEGISDGPSSIDSESELIEPEDE
ncbi:MAG: efflux RND transporter periplasmic adaptor subunit [Eubacterium sp.]|nr:efflux RND transporter periplasmic adaptor subunit [Eubacterium sp.]